MNVVVLEEISCVLLYVLVYAYLNSPPPTSDPLLPWIFMGEEISMSARLWTAGYDIFAPPTNVLNHYYVRRHYPKFWESVNRSVCLVAVEGHESWLIE